jgi:hypothetical protein
MKVFSFLFELCVGLLSPGGTFSEPLTWKNYCIAFGFGSALFPFMIFIREIFVCLTSQRSLNFSLLVSFLTDGWWVCAIAGCFVLLIAAIFSPQKVTEGK